MLYRQTHSAPVFGLRREIDRLFEDTFGRGEGANGWMPAVDVRENDNELGLDLEIPGMTADDLEITAENGVLTVRGEKRSARKEGDEESRYHVMERSYGSFVRSFQLPQGLDETKIEADCNDGVLSIHIPKAALPQPRKIQIAAKKQGRINQGDRSSSNSTATHGDSQTQRPNVRSAASSSATS